MCPIHNVQLVCKKWQSVLSKENYLNPRMVYDTGGNVVFIQRYYECASSGSSTWLKHTFLSASKSIMDAIPRNLANKLPIILHYKSALTHDLLDNLWTSIEIGQNFVKITERLASLNYRNFQRRKLILGEHTSNAADLQSFHGNVLYSFPSNDKLMHIFLCHYEETKHIFHAEMQKLTGTVMSFDHTFKVSKHIGIVRNDNSFVKQFDGCFFGMNGYGEVVAWRLTKTTGFKEIEDLLFDLKERMLNSGINLEVIILDDCCKMRNSYQNVFGGNVKIKLDLFHACQRVIQTLDHDGIKNQFSREFGLIFRVDGDVGEEREMTTPEPEVIIANLEQLLCRWQGQLNAKTLKSVDDLRRHINKGCLSGILPREGTEKNERLDRHLRKSLLVGANTISPELAIACLTLALYVWNNRKKSVKHIKNQRVVPIIPAEYSEDISNNCASSTALPFKVNNDASKEIPPPFADKTKERLAMGPTEQDADQCGNTFLHVTVLDDLLDSSTVMYIIERTLQLYETVQKINNQCAIRSLNLLDFPLLSGFKEHASLIRCSDYDNII